MLGVVGWIIFGLSVGVTDGVRVSVGVVVAVSVAVRVRKPSDIRIAGFRPTGHCQPGGKSPRPLNSSRNADRSPWLRAAPRN